MKIILLTHGYSATVDDSDWANLNQHNWHVLFYAKNKYAARTTKKHGKTKRILMHHAIIGKPNMGFCIDHINGNGLDNRRENLRICNNQQNSINKHGLNKSNTSGFRGVHWNKSNSKWVSVIRVNYKHIYLGSFVSKEDANLAYVCAAKKHYGEYYNGK